MKALIGMIVCGLLAWIIQIVLVFLKLTDFLDWPWYMILLPLVAIIALTPCAYFGVIAYGIKKISKEVE